MERISPQKKHFVAAGLLIVTGPLTAFGIISGWFQFAADALALAVELQGVELHQGIELPWRRDAAR